MFFLRNYTGPSDVHDGSTCSACAWEIHAQVHPVFGSFEQRSRLRGGGQDTLVVREGSSSSMKLGSLYARTSKPGPMFPIGTTYNEVEWFKAGAPTFDAIAQVMSGDGIGREWPIKGRLFALRILVGPSYS